MNPRPLDHQERSLRCFPVFFGCFLYHLTDWPAILVQKCGTKQGGSIDHPHTWNIAMPARHDLTWDPENRRWRVQHQGKRFVVSCKQLGVAGTKEASYQAANAWWEAKQDELRGAQTAPHPHRDMLSELDARMAWARRHGHLRDIEDLKAKRDLVESLSEDSEDLVDQVVGFSSETEELIELARRHGIEIPRDLNIHVKDLIFGKSRVWDARLRSEKQPDIPEDRTLSGLCRRYMEQHDLRRLAGDLSSGECYLISHHTLGFVEWIGAGRTPDAITPSRWEDYWKYLLKRVGAGEISAVYGTKYMKYARRFIVWVASMGLMQIPPNLHNKGYRFPSSAKPLVTFTVDEAIKLVEAAPGQLKLHLLLMLNCGFTQSDISSLRHDEIDLKAGMIARQRSKTRVRHGDSVPKVVWTLWPITLELLRKYRSSHATLALTTERGKPWVEEGLKADGKPYSRDSIQSNFRHIQKRLGQSKTLKSFRKTSASLLDDNTEYGRYAQHFLGHAADTVAGRHYVSPSQAQFNRAVAWLGGQFGFAGTTMDSTTGSSSSSISGPHDS